MIQHAAVTLMDHPRVVCSPRNSRDQVDLSVADFASFRPRDLSPLRKMPARRGSGAFVGRWWFASTGEHVAFGSLVERDILMVLDFMGEIVEIVERPMMVLPTRTARSPLPSPFLFVLSRDGARRLLIREDDDESVTLATGLVVVGARTKSVPDGEIIRSITPMRPLGRTAQRYRAALRNHLYPPVEGLRIEVIPRQEGELVLLEIPPQPEELRPFLVHGAIVDGRSQGAFIGIVRRDDDISIPTTAASIHATLAAGRALLRQGTPPSGTGS